MSNESEKWGAKKNYLKLTKSTLVRKQMTEREKQKERKVAKRMVKSPTQGTIKRVYVREQFETERSPEMNIIECEPSPESNYMTEVKKGKGSDAVIARTAIISP